LWRGKSKRFLEERKEIKGKSEEKNNNNNNNNKNKNKKRGFVS
jgi:hypothetical protein